MAARRNDRREARVTEGMAFEQLDVADRVVTAEEDDAAARDEAEGGGRPRRPPPDDRPARDGGSLWDVLDKSARFFGSLGVAAAALIAAAEYVNSNSDKRSERSLEIVRSWQKDGVDQQYNKVRDFVAERFQPMRPVIAALPNDAARAAAFPNLGQTWLEQARAELDPQGIEDSVDKLILFFSQMEVCITAGLCDTRVLRLYFHAEVSSFWQYFSLYADDRQQEGYDDYGSQVERLLTRFDAEADQ